MSNSLVRKSAVAAVVLAGALVAASGAFAGADDGQSKAFWAIPSAGSASGPQNNPAAVGQPNSSVTRGGNYAQYPRRDGSYQATAPGQYYDQDEQ